MARTQPSDGDAYVQASRTLIDLLRRRTAQDPDRVAYSFLARGEEEQGSLTFSDVDTRARAIAASLRSVSGTGGRALLLYPAGLEYVSAFFGCVYGGVTAVPSYPLDPERLHWVVPRIRSIIGDAQPVVALTTASSLRLIERLAEEHAEFRDIRWVATEAIPDRLAADWESPTVGPDALAVLIYTSGSTATPKGVMLTHRNVLENERMVRNAYGYSRDTTFVSWVPLASAWGVVNTVVQPVYTAARSVLMAPEAFVQRPVRWLRAISRYPSVTSGGPNYAYELCAGRITAEERAGLDLSGWNWAVIAAEPVRTPTLDRFAEAFAPCGFRREALHPAYGLSEATMAATDTPRFRGPRILHVQREALEQNEVRAAPAGDVRAMDVVSCGRSQPEQTLLIVEPDSCLPCPPGRVGEVWISGGNVAAGYWNRPEETAQTFRGFRGDTGEGPFLRTGDLGFLHEEELFVIGRLKDLIIVRGRNYHPQDVELTAERCHPAPGPGCTAAFSVQTETEERLVIAQEVADPEQGASEEAMARIRQAVFAEHEVLAHAVVLVRAGGIPRSANGKLQRRACRESYLAGTLDAVAVSLLGNSSGDRRSRRSVAPRTPTERRLAEMWRALLNVEHVGLYDNFLDLGGNPHVAGQCRSRMRDAFRVDLPVEMLLADTANVRELGVAIDRLLGSGHATEGARGGVPDSPV